MSEKNTTNFGLTSRINHWVIAFAIIGMVAVGLYLEFGNLERADKRFLMGIHKSTGVLVLIYGFWRVAWRLLKGFPDTVAKMPNWQKTASKISHYLLLACILLMPISGVAWSIFSGYGVDVFGWFTIPAQEKIEWVGTVASNFHRYAGRTLAALILLHIAAALKHHFYDKDKTLTRMMKGET